MDLCEACKTNNIEVILENEAPLQPYKLCVACENRLSNLALRPLEWYNIVVIHGPWKHLLHDDFYDENGKADVPEIPVEDSEKFPCPTIYDVQKDIHKSIDYVFTKHYLNSPEINLLSHFNKNDLFIELCSRKVIDVNVSHENMIYNIIAEVLDDIACSWIRQRWKVFHPSTFEYLCKATCKCFPNDEAYSLIINKFNEMAPEDKFDNMYALTYLHDRRIIEWIISNCNTHNAGQFGRLAAASNITWETIQEWFKKGRPLSHIAMFALQTYADNRSEFYDPYFLININQATFETILNSFYESDKVPRVRKGIQYFIDIHNHLQENK